MVSTRAVDRGSSLGVQHRRWDASGAADISGQLGPNPYDVECRHFVEAIRGAADVELLDAEAALDGLRVVEAARRSLREGAAVAPLT